MGTMDMVRRNSLDIELSVAPVDCIRSLRKLCEDKNWSLERHEGARLVDRFAIIMPMAQSARTLGLKVLDGPLMGLELTTWSEVRGSAGARPHLFMDSSWWPSTSKDSELVATLGCQSPKMSLAMDVWRAIKDWLPPSNMEEITALV